MLLGRWTASQYGSACGEREGQRVRQHVAGVAEQRQGSGPPACHGFHGGECQGQYQGEQQGPVTALACVVMMVVGMRVMMAHDAAVAAWQDRMLAKTSTGPQQDTAWHFRPIWHRVKVRLPGEGNPMRTTMARLRKFLDDDQGLTVVEYAVAAGLITATVAGTMQVLGLTIPEP